MCQTNEPNIGDEGHPAPIDPDLDATINEPPF